MHSGHKGMVQFARADGSPLRPEWGRVVADGEEMSDEEAQRRVEAMDEAMVERWNAIVPKNGKVYVLGDVVINRRALPILDRLNGKKKLILGNHDLFLKDYAGYFYEVAAYRVMNDLVMSHIPIHAESVKQRWKANVHGHLHDGRVMKTVYHEWSADGQSGVWSEEVIDPRYLCVSAEHTNYAPISLDEVYQRINEQQKEVH